MNYRKKQKQNRTAKLFNWELKTSGLVNPLGVLLRGKWSDLVPDLLVLYYPTTAKPPHFTVQSSIRAEATAEIALAANIYR